MVAAEIESFIPAFLSLAGHRDGRSGIEGVGRAPAGNRRKGLVASKVGSVVQPSIT